MRKTKEVNAFGTKTLSIGDKDPVRSWYNVVTNDVVIENDSNNNWYETMFVFMIILIWGDAAIDDYVYMRYCCW